MDELIAEAARRIRASRRLLIGTGAGMSADSGIPTYRRPGEQAWRAYAVYESHGLRAEDLACPRAFEEEPELAWGFWERQRRAIAARAPHEGYASLHAIASSVPEAFVQTTNVDGFHLRAGWPADRLHEIHGSWWRLQHCVRAWPELRVPLLALDDAGLRAQDRPRCPSCGAPPRPHALMFADLEYIGDRRAEAARRAFHEAGPDLVLTVGESGVIATHAQDAAELRRRFGAVLIDINPDPQNKAAAQADIAIPLGAREALMRLELVLARAKI